MQVLETYPRDELFQISVDELFPIALAVVHLQERRQLRLFVREDIYGRYMSCLVYLPRDRFNTAVRERFQQHPAPRHSWQVNRSHGAAQRGGAGAAALRHQDGAGPGRCPTSTSPRWRSSSPRRLGRGATISPTPWRIGSVKSRRLDSCAGTGMRFPRPTRRTSRPARQWRTSPAWKSYPTTTAWP